MPEQPPIESPASEPPPPILSAGSGLRLRIWIASMAGAFAAAAGIWWVIGVQIRPQTELDLPLVVTLLAAVAGAGIVVGAAAALWFDRGLIGHVRGLNHGIHAGQVARLRGLPGSAGWGELSELTQRVQHLISQHRRMARAADELGLARAQLAQLREALERWNETEEWHDLRTDSGPLAPVCESLNHGLRRIEEVREQNLEVARQIADEVAHALDEARESSEQAERGFVEATSLLTTVRELQRLESELDRTRGTGLPAAGRADVTPFLAAARDAIEELVTASTGSVERLSASLVHVTEIAEQVRVLGNRSTLIALHAAVAGSDMSPDVHVEMRQLAAEVQTATARATELCRAVEREAAAALSRMRDVRGPVAARLEAIPQVPSGFDAADDTPRLLERMREMIHDAARKSERLSAAGERVSRAAERLVRALEEEASELAGLSARLTRPGADGIMRPEAARAGLRLLDSELEADDIEVRHSPGNEPGDPRPAREERP
jgi:hypothetical protein